MIGADLVVPLLERQAEHLERQLGVQPLEEDGHEVDVRPRDPARRAPRGAPARPRALPFGCSPCSTTTRRAVALPKRASAETARSRRGCSSASSNGASAFFASIDSSPWTIVTSAASDLSCRAVPSPAIASFTRGGGSAGSASETRTSSSASGRLFRRARDAPDEVEEVALEVPVLPRDRLPATRRRRPSAVARASAPWISRSERSRRRRSRFSSHVQLLDELAPVEAREEREDAGERLVVPGVLAEGADALEVHGLLRLSARALGRARNRPCSRRRASRRRRTCGPPARESPG